MMKKTAQRDLVATLLAGGIAVVRTDTLYGIVARADDEAAVERVYAAKGRNPGKSCIVLIAHREHAYGENDDVAFEWDEPTSVLVASPQAPAWLLRENELIAHRLPKVEWLQEVIAQTGPLIAPSANPEGLPPAMTIDEAKAYFGEQVDRYVDGGEVPGDMPPSRLIRIHNDGTLERLR